MDVPVQPGVGDGVAGRSQVVEVVTGSVVEVVDGGCEVVVVVDDGSVVEVVTGSVVEVVEGGSEVVVDDGSVVEVVDGGSPWPSPTQTPLRTNFEGAAPA